MHHVPHIAPSNYFAARKTLRFLARDSKNPSAALVYWLGVTEPSCEPSFFDAVQKYGPLLQMVLTDERPGVFVKREAVHAVQDCGAVKRLVFKDQSSLDVRYEGPGRDLYGGE
jgi:hypothetical protein